MAHSDIKMYSRSLRAASKASSTGNRPELDKPSRTVSSRTFSTENANWPGGAPVFVEPASSPMSFIRRSKSSTPATVPRLRLTGDAAILALDLKKIAPSESRHRSSTSKWAEVSSELVGEMSDKFNSDAMRRRDSQKEAKERPTAADPSSTPPIKCPPPPMLTNCTQPLPLSRKTPLTMSAGKICGKRFRSAQNDLKSRSDMPSVGGMTCFSPTVWSLGFRVEMPLTLKLLSTRSSISLT
mmetsp:Transcript_19975/g.37255  ORF Transcript_19975/g.37255 Transcript_19975/m.37255 type:complete len:240 (-) Transcript_19975:1644-2363(-)